MNRRRFLMTASATGAVLVMPPLLAEMTPHRYMPTHQELLDGIAIIEEEELGIAHIYLHADDVPEFVRMLNSLPGTAYCRRGWDEETVEFFQSEGIVGYIYGAVIAVNPHAERGVVLLQSDEPYATDSGVEAPQEIVLIHGGYKPGEARYSRFSNLYEGRLMLPSLRRVERKTHEGWKRVLFKDLKRGDTFKLTDPANSPVRYETGFNEYIAASDAQRIGGDGGNYGIEIEENQ